MLATVKSGQFNLFTVCPYLLIFLGGWPTDALNYMRDEGISDGRLYQYKAVKGDCLRTYKPPIRAPAILKIPNSCELSLEGNETYLMNLIAQYGPVAGAMGEFRTFQ